MSRDINFVKYAFAGMTFLVIGALIFESLARIAFITFLVLMVVLWGNKGGSSSLKLNRHEKGWLIVSVLYAFVFVFSFLLRPPYVEDGIWRLSAPGFIILLSLWFLLIIRYQIQKWAVQVVAISILIWGEALLGIEWWAFHPHLLDANYKLGQYYSNIGASGFILPLGATLLLILAINSPNKWGWWVLAAFAAILVILVKKRTPAVMFLFALFGAGGWVLVRAQWLTIWKKMMAIFVAICVMGGTLWVQKDTVLSAYNDYIQAEENDNFVTSLGLRYEMVNIGLDLISEKPLSGWGPNQYKSEGLFPYIDRMDLSENGKKLLKSFTHIHNQYLMDWVLSGIAGIASLLLILGYPFWIFKCWASRGEPGAWVAMGGVMGIMIVMLFGALFTYTYTTIAFMLSIGGLVAWASQQLEEGEV